MADLVRRGLEEEGFAVDVAGTVADATWLLEENEYDAVVLDVVLPDGSGLDILRTLREREVWSPVLMLTARDAVDDRVHALDAGADDYLTKPFAFDELNARVRSLMRRGAPARPAILSVGDLSLDPARHIVRRNGMIIDLTGKEFALLEYFMRRPGEVLSKTTLIEHVWDFAFDSDSNVIEVYIGYLRSKIDRPFGKSSLQTIRGAGYRLVEQDS